MTNKERSFLMVFQLSPLISNYYKKSHTCEEDGAFIFWYLLTNLKNKQLFKKLLKWANKKQNFNIYNVEFFLKR